MSNWFFRSMEVRKYRLSRFLFSKSLIGNLHHTTAHVFGKPCFQNDNTKKNYATDLRSFFTQNLKVIPIIKLRKINLFFDFVEFLCYTSRITTPIEQSLRPHCQRQIVIFIKTLKNEDYQRCNSSADASGEREFSFESG